MQASITQFPDARKLGRTIVRRNRLAAMMAAATLLAAAMQAGAADTAFLIEQAMNGAHRSDAYIARNQYRHPKETLLFFGLKADMTVVEITPGGGWYSEILAPVLRDHGTYYAASYRITADSREFFRRMDARYRAKLDADPEIYANVKLVYFDPQSPAFAPAGSVDMVLTFRNVHNWARADTTESMFKGFFKALKPGGVLGVIDHRAKPGTPFNLQIESGYMTEDYVIDLATKAGFRLDARSEINANPRDTADHPGGVWNLLPSLRDVAEADVPRILTIGESDRLTLRFVKP